MSHQMKSFESIEYDPFSSPQIDKVLGLLDAQKEIWVSCKLGGDEANIANNLSTSLHLKGKLKINVLHKAIEELVKRHEVLRMTFSPDGKKSIIYDFFPPDYMYLDSSGISSHQEKKSVFKKLIEEESLTLFNLEKGPLIRFRLIRLDEHFHILIITGHHIIIDGWSNSLITKELGIIYSDLSENKPITLYNPVLFSDYSSQMSLWSQGPEYRKTEEYWIDRYKGKNFYLNLPTDKPRPSSRTFNSQRMELTVDADLLEAIRKVGIKAKSSLVNTLLAVFEIYFHKLTGQKQLSLGIPVSGQAVSDNFHLVGHCVHLLPIPCTIEPHLTFLEYLHKRKSELLNDYEHSRYTFSSLLQHLNLPRENSTIPLIPIIINFESAKNDQFNYKDLAVESFFNPKKFETFENAIYVTEYEDRISINWQYNTILYTPESIKKMQNEFRNLLIFVSENPSTIISNIDFIENVFLKEINQWNNTSLDNQMGKTFTSFINETANKHPQKVAVSCSKKQLSYLELEAQSNQLANYLLQNGVKKGDIIGICVDRSVEMLVSLLGIVKSGGVYLPLDPLYPKERIEMMVNDASCKYFLVSGHLKGNYITQAPFLLLEEVMAQLNDFSEQSPEIGLKGNDLVYVIYTSGSTGTPKGVKISHHNLLNFLLSMQISPGISSRDKLLAVTTISFDIAGLELFLPLIAGAEVVITENEEARDGRILLDLIEREKITMMQATPATWKMMINSSWKKHFPLKVLCGGEALPQDLAKELLSRSNALWNMYGPTETTVWSLMKKITTPDLPITIGKPIHNTQVYILDENCHLLSPGNVGEIWIGGQGVAKGYLNRSELTNEKFITNDFEASKSDLLYRTGDLGKFLPNGEVMCLGRLDNQVKIRGFRIELGEIENSINQLPEISDVVVIAREDHPGDLNLVAYVIEKNGNYSVPNLSGNLSVENGENFHQVAKSIDKQKIIKWKDFLYKSLPDYMVPGVWVSMIDFPKTSNNKINRKAFPPPTQSGMIRRTSQNQTLSENEKLVSKIWCKLLRLDVIAKEDNFFELGGHSLMAVEVMAELENETHLNLPLNTLFQNPTLSEFAAVLDKGEKSQQGWNSLVAIKPEGNKIPLYIIHGAGANVSPFYKLASVLDVDQPVYGLQAKGLNGIDEPFHTIKEMAAHYIEEIIRQNPNGPYYLAGQSFGAYVAFEMAKQMKAGNLKVQKVLLLDVSAYQSDKVLTDWQNRKRSVVYEIQKRLVDVKLLFTAFNTFKDLKSKSFYRKKRKFQKLVGLEKGGNDIGLFHRIEEIRKINHNAMDEYILTPYSGEIILFKSSIQTFYEPDSVFYSWNKYADSVKVVEVEGDHNSIFEEPNLIIGFADKIQKVLDQT